jgi:C4-dicarboxylate-specific signal transduction histidine kinase
MESIYDMDTRFVLLETRFNNLMAGQEDKFITRIKELEELNLKLLKANQDMEKEFNKLLEANQNMEQEFNKKLEIQIELLDEITCKVKEYSDSLIQSGRMDYLHNMYKKNY